MKKKYKCKGCKRIDYLYFDMPRLTFMKPREYKDIHNKLNKAFVEVLRIEFKKMNGKLLERTYLDNTDVKAIALHESILHTLQCKFTDKELFTVAFVGAVNKMFDSLAGKGLLE